MTTADDPTTAGPLRVVGHVHSSLADPHGAPRQPEDGAPPARIEVTPTHAEAMVGLAAGDRVVVVTWLHLADREVLGVHPRRDPSRPRRGVFSTRSPVRPNPIGLHEVTVTGVDGTTLRVDALDAVDGTPVLDVRRAGPRARRDDGGHVVLTGVSGAGKTVVGRRVAAALGRRFVEGDDHHPQANRDRMAAGLPLDDDDRAPWLAALADELADAAARDEPVVLACSALKRAHRQRLRASGVPVRFVLLEVPPAVAAERVGGRQGHFMPSSLVGSQFAALEVDVDLLVVDATLAVDDVVAASVALVRSGARASGDPAVVDHHPPDDATGDA